MRTKNTYTVGQITGYIKGLFAEDFMLREIRVSGEVSNCKYHSSGHLYFTLKDEKAALSAVMFAGNRRGLSFPMKNGDKVVASGSVEVYEKSGSYQLYARTIEKEGQGELFLKYQRLKEELEEMGMFAPEYKKPIPKYALRIGIVTASTGAAIQDIVNIAGRRNPYAELILCPARVQGEGAAQSIAAGIRRLDKLGLDVIIVGRGGGSFEDLFAFNEEIVVRAVFDCETPIISAVGHETDTSLSDFAADLRAPTPSAAAELAVFDYRALLMDLESDLAHMHLTMERKVRFLKERLRSLQAGLFGKEPIRQLELKSRRLLELRALMDREIAEKLRERKHTLALLSEAMNGASPLSRLSKGYAYVSDEKGKKKSSAAEILPGDRLRIRFSDGTVDAVAEETELFS